MKKIILSLAFFILSTVCSVHAGEREFVYRSILKVKQHRTYVYDQMGKNEMIYYGKRIGRADDLGNTLAALPGVESSYGKHRIGDHGKAYGITQMHAPTARYIINNLMDIPVNLTDREIRLLLTYNDKAAMILSKYYMNYLIHNFNKKKRPWRHAVLAYNFGITNVKKYGLSKDPMNYLGKIKKQLFEIMG
jgi:hypothetical protein